MALLSELLAHHDRFSRYSSLPENLGDGFLCYFNPVYRNLREGFLALDGKFTDEDFCNYRTFKLAALPQILDANRVFVAENVSAFRAVETKRPGTFSHGDLNFRAHNYLLHESAHCVAHQ